MKPQVHLLATLTLAAAMAVAGATSTAAAQTAAGTIRGRIRLTGKLPGNAIIRMGRDPKCAEMNRGKRVLQELVVTSADGGLANVFVKLQGKFPQTPVPAAPVAVDQRSCVYTPRMVGARVGQTVEIKNSDQLLHNVHAISNLTNGFNVGQPVAGLVYKFVPKAEEMVRVKCEVHSWMTLFVGVVSHPYFAVSGNTGSFEIAKVPPGNYTVEAWHEQYGMLTKTVRVTAGATATVDFAYTGAEKPAAK